MERYPIYIHYIQFPSFREGSATPLVDHQELGLLRNAWIERRKNWMLGMENLPWLRCLLEIKIIFGNQWKNYLLEFENQCKNSETNGNQWKLMIF